ncbi:MAG: large protein, partial [Chitinophagaceae bacterium]|nr:large protein [Chitinophagaceae bacterium]
FFVRVTTVNGTGSLAIAKGARVTNALTDVWRTESAVEKKISLTVANGSGNSDEMIVRFRDDATEDYDGTVDAPKVLNDAGVPSIFSCSPGVDYAINSLPSSLDQKTIPLQLNVEVDTMCTWSANLTGFNSNESVTLEDRLYGTVQDLTTSPVFSIQLNKGVYANRFFLQYSQPQKNVTGTTSSINNNSGIEIRAIQSDVFLLFTNENPGNANIAIFDALGKEVYESQNTNTSSGRIDISLPEVSNGVYIVKVQTPSATKSQQIILQK